jgi:hypothetical protein
MTAIPVDKALPKTNEFAPKFLLKGGNILEAEIQGGPYTIEKGLKELENYRADYKYQFSRYSLSTVCYRQAKETDTTKWITLCTTHILINESLSLLNYHYSLQE